jgi:hypothetical protein
MSNMTELLARLAEREQARFAAEQEAKIRIREAEFKTTLAAQEFMELRRANEQELKVLRAKAEKNLRDTSYKCQQDVHAAQAQVTEAEAFADQAEKRQRSADAIAFAYLEKVKHMEAHVQRRTKKAEVNNAELQRSMDTRIKRVDKQNQSRAANMEAHAKEVCTVSKLALETVSEELQDQVAKAHVRSEGRVRFKELCHLASTFGNYDVSRDAYFHVKHELIDLWHQQKAAAPLGSSCPRTASPMAEASPKKDVLALEDSLAIKDTVGHATASRPQRFC